MGWGKSPVRRVMSCHISCNPSSPALKTLTLFLNPRSLLLWQPHRRPSKPDTQPITPYPSSPWLFVMAWLGLFRGKLTMSGISGVMKKMKIGVAAQKDFWGDGEETHIKVQLACSLILKPLKNIHSRQWAFKYRKMPRHSLLFNLLFSCLWFEKQWMNACVHEQLGMCDEEQTGQILGYTF